MLARSALFCDNDAQKLISQHIKLQLIKSKFSILGNEVLNLFSGKFLKGIRFTKEANIFPGNFKTKLPKITSPQFFIPEFVSPQET